jgi:hypothetical protein
MQSTTRAARTRRYLSRHERQRRARARAFSRRTTADPEVPPPVKLDVEDLALIDRLVRHDRTAVSSALLAIAGIGTGGAVRRAVLVRVSEATCWAQAEGAISSERAAQIARHVKRALQRGDVPITG